MALLNYTTKVDPEQTISEIQRMLSKHGVTAMMTEYEGHQVSAVSFQIRVNDKPMGFKLPCNWRAFRKVLGDQGLRRIDHKDKNPDNQAVRVAWRIIYEWMGAQLALVEVNMVTVPQVFLPYMKVNAEQTLYEKMAIDPNFLLGDGK